MHEVMRLYIRSGRGEVGGAGGWIMRMYVQLAGNMFELVGNFQVTEKQ
jgi:hypothetical protein